MDVGDCVGDSFDFEVTALHVDRSLRPSYSNNIINNTTGGNAISRILAVCGCQPATPPASIPRGSIGGASYRIVLNRDYRYTKQHCASGPLRLYDIL